MTGELFNPEAFEQLPGQMSMEQCLTMGDPVDETPERKLGRDIVVGDIIVFLGHPHRIAEISDYSHNPWGFVGWHGDPWRIAKARDGWGITLDPDQRFEVA